MFIRKTKTATNRDGTARGSYRLVQSERDGEKVRQRTLLNLGASFGVEKEKWKLLCQRVEELLSAQHHFSFAGPDLELESEARRIAKRLLERQGQAPEEPGEKDFQTVDVNSAEDFRRAHRRRRARRAGGPGGAGAAAAARRARLQRPPEMLGAGLDRGAHAGAGLGAPDLPVAQEDQRAG